MIINDSLYDAIKEIADVEAAPFNDLVNLATKLSDSPIAFISFFSSDRQIFKACTGIELISVPIQQSPCLKTVESSRPFIVEDVSRNSCNPDATIFKQFPHFKFFASFPIVNTENSVIGTFCLVDTKTRELTNEQKESMEILCRQVLCYLKVIASEKILAQRDETIAHLIKPAGLGNFTLILGHELNNSVSIHKMSLNIAMDEIRRTGANNKLIQSMCDRVEKSILKIQKIISGIKIYTRNAQKDLPERVSLTLIINETLELMRPSLLLMSIKLELKFPDTDIYAFCRASEMSQVILNLVSNSIDAIAGLPEKWIKIEIKEVIDHLECSVTDSGHLPSEEIISKIMNPYYTTKAQGSGTGLGLSICKSIIDSHGGELSIDLTCPNTRFVMTLPSCQEA